MSRYVDRAVSDLQLDNPKSQRICRRQQTRNEKYLALNDNRLLQERLSLSNHQSHRDNLHLFHDLTN